MSHESKRIGPVSKKVGDVDRRGVKVSKPAVDALIILGRKNITAISALSPLWYGRETVVRNDSILE
jgi:hypothetical protein